MSQTHVDRIAQAVLYEGYILYPYRQSVKNRQRWTFGGLYPAAYAEAQRGADVWRLESETLLEGTEATRVEVTLRFLHLTLRQVWADGPVDELVVGGRAYRTWEEAVERTVTLGPMTLGELLAGEREVELGWPAERSEEPLAEAGEHVVGSLRRERRAVSARLVVAARVAGPAAPVAGAGTSVLGGAAPAAGASAPTTPTSPSSAPTAFRLSVRVANTTPYALPEPRRGDALRQTLVSAHLLLHAEGGDFVSLTDPPPTWRPDADACVNRGVWPVLVGEPGARDAMLASPLILSDYPEIAPESPGDLFDGTEIDEILTLRVLTLTDAEKREMCELDDRARDLLERTEALTPDQLLALHGVLRQPRAGSSLPGGLP